MNWFEKLVLIGMAAGSGFYVKKFVETDESLWIAKAVAAGLLGLMMAIDWALVALHRRVQRERGRYED